jgi:hypothetical protein
MGASGVSYPKVRLFSASPVFLMMNHGMKLFITDEKKTEIAKFYRAHHFRKKRKARLEVQPAGMDMLDHIVLTFVFAESKRRDREARARWQMVTMR